MNADSRVKMFPAQKVWKQPFHGPIYQDNLSLSASTSNDHISTHTIGTVMQHETALIKKPSSSLSIIHCNNKSHFTSKIKKTDSSQNAVNYHLCQRGYVFIGVCLFVSQ